MSSPGSPPVSSPPCVTPPPVDATAWFKQEVHPHDGQLKNYLRGNFPSVRDVEDVVQESYLRIWKLQSWRQIRSAKAFLFTTARRIAISAIRRLHRSPFQQVGDIDSFGVLAPEDPIAFEKQLEAKMNLLADAIAALPERRRQIVLLRRFDLLTCKETAAKLGLSEKTVENQLSRALVQCEEFMRIRGVQSLYSDENR